MNIQELSNTLPLLVRFYIQIPNWKETIYYTEYSFQQCMHQHILKYFLGGCLPARKKNEQSKACGSDWVLAGHWKALSRSQICPQESCLGRTSALKPDSEFSSPLSAPLGRAPPCSWGSITTQGGKQTFTICLCFSGCNRFVIPLTLVRGEAGWEKGKGTSGPSVRQS